jgi:hypothetical protein
LCFTCTPHVFCIHEANKHKCRICNKCEHGSFKYSCTKCRPELICPHGKSKYRCTPCLNAKKMSRL